MFVFEIGCWFGFLKWSYIFPFCNLDLGSTFLLLVCALGVCVDWLLQANALMYESKAHSTVVAWSVDRVPSFVMIRCAQNHLQNSKCQENPSWQENYVIGCIKSVE